MNRRRSDFEKGLRVSLASLFEHEPRTAVLCVCFDRYQPGLHTKFSIQGTGEDKARRAFAKHGPSFLEILSGLAALAHEKNHGSLPTLRAYPRTPAILNVTMVT